MNVKNALFAGPSGTAKTMAADMVANGLKLDLYRIDVAGRDSGNWYANLEISSLLQKIEEYDGISTLTINQRQDFDASVEAQPRSTSWHGRKQAASAGGSRRCPADP